MPSATVQERLNEQGSGDADGQGDCNLLQRVEVMNSQCHDHLATSSKIFLTPKRLVDEGLQNVGNGRQLERHITSLMADNCIVSSIHRVLFVL